MRVDRCGVGLCRDSALVKLNINVKLKIGVPTLKERRFSDVDKRERNVRKYWSPRAGGPVRGGTLQRLCSRGALSR